MTVAGQVPGPLPEPVLLRHRHPLRARGLLEGNTPYLDCGQLPGAGVPGADRCLPRAGAADHASRSGAPTGTGTQRSTAGRRHADLLRRQRRCCSARCLLITVWAQVRSVPHRPWDAMMLAASPCVAAAALINWDLLADRPDRRSACCSGPAGGPVGPGVFWGLGMAAKLYPLLPARPAAVPVSAVGPAAGVRDDAGRLRGQLGAGEPAGDDLGAGRLAELLAATTPAGAATSARSGTSCRWPAARSTNLNLLAVGLFALGCLGHRGVDHGRARGGRGSAR